VPEIRKRVTYANVMSTIAVVLAMGGATAVAATTLGKNSVGTKQLKQSAVTGAKVLDGSLEGVDINLSTLGKVPSALVADSVTAAQTAVNADHARTADTAGRAAQATTADSAINAGHAKTADEAARATRANTADTATDAEHALTADDAAHAAEADNVNHAADADHADDADHATNADRAARADRVDRADNADRADRATNADHADRATNADRADRATNADRADSAARADRADNADRADRAARADNADRADRATNADRADRATSADRATEADRATRAGALDAPERPHAVGGNGEPPFENGWTNVNSLEPTKFYIDRQGRVYLQGRVRQASGNETTIFHVPPAYAPANFQLFSILTVANGNALPGSVLITPSGQVEFNGGTSAAVFLNGISWRAASSEP